MTMHAAKGLEFPVVYIIGVESGLIPHERAVRNGDPAAFQEERRLLFVGVTRAMQELNLTQTRRRDFRGNRRSTISSPFLTELNLDVVNDHDGSFAPAPASLSLYAEKVEQARQRYRESQVTSPPTAAGGGLPGIMSAAELERKLAGLKAAPESVPSAAPVSDRAAPAEVAAKMRMQTINPHSHGPASEAPLYEIGSRVRHPRYGRGVVVDAKSGSSRATVTVLFEADDREETFVAAHCPLQPVGNARPR
jgi:DNA helicase-2/ATP-dependent DNA helicase PcrA